MKLRDKITGIFLKGPIIKKECLFCGNDFECKPSLVKTKKYCSKDCMNKNMSILKVGKNPPYMNNKELKEKSIKKMIESKTGLSIWGGKRSDMDWVKGEKSYWWQGDRVNYRELHRWVQRWLGKADHCEQCGKTGGDKRYHWANIDHKYRRVLEDYIQLCPKCHYNYDVEHGLRAKKA